MTKLNSFWKTIVCQIDTVNTQYTHLCRLLHISKFMRFFGGPSWPNICVWGTKCNFKDWEKFAPWDLEERRTDLEGQRHRTSRSHSAASRLVLYLGAGNIIEKIIDSWHMSIFQVIWKLSISKKIYSEIVTSYQYKKMCIQFHPTCSKNKKSAQSCTALLEEHFGF